MTSLCPLSCGVCTFNCTDQHESCVPWAQDGQCEENPLMMYKVARERSNPHPHPHPDPNPPATLTLALTPHPMMYKECPIACGVCTPDCKDTKKQCAGWAQAGGCNDNPGFMSLHCPVTCGVCKDKCKDRAADCPGWTAQGECYNNAQFMYHKCPSSCGVCEMGQCVDKNETQCAARHLAPHPSHTQPLTTATP